MQHILENQNPEFIAIEQTFVNINPQSSLKLGMVRGAIITCIAKIHVIDKIFEYSANHVKKSIAGFGHATKTDILNTINRYYLTKHCNNLAEDEADAIAIALCCYYNCKNNKA